MRKQDLVMFLKPFEVWRCLRVMFSIRCNKFLRIAIVVRSIASMNCCHLWAWFLNDLLPSNVSSTHRYLRHFLLQTNQFLISFCRIEIDADSTGRDLQTSNVSKFLRHPFPFTIWSIYIELSFVGKHQTLYLREGLEGY